MIELFSANNKISLRQLQFLLILDIFGNGVTILPRVVSAQAGKDGWIGIIIATILAVFSVYIICAAAGRFAQKSFYAYVSELLSKPVAIAVCALFIFKIIASLALELYIFAQILRQFMLSSTPIWVLSAAMLAIGSYAAAKGFEARARMAEVLVVIIFIPFVFMFILAAVSVDFTNLLPVMQTSPKKILLGGGASFFSFSGIEFILLSFSYMNRAGSVKKSAVSATALLGLMFIFITVVTVARFGVTEVQRQLWPVIEMMDSVNLPGSFIERQSAVVLSLWIVSVFAAVSAKMFFSSIICNDILNKGKQKSYIFIIFPVVLLLSILPRDTQAAYYYMNMLDRTAGIFFMTVLPLVLLAAAKIRKRGESL